MPLVKKTERIIRRHELLAGREHVLVAVSGGADSVALLHVLCALKKRYRLIVSVLHVQHGLRGAAAEEDARFVRTLAKRLRVDFRQKRSNVKALAKRRKISLEMAAREARYAFFRECARALDGPGGVVLATAHTSDDQAETLLLRLTRGAGGTGLAAIARRRKIKGVQTIRPFLDVGREEIIAYLRQQKLEWREDASNQEDRFLRNRVRHEVLPLLSARLNPNARGALNRAADILREEDAWMDSLAAELVGQCLAADGSLRVDVLCEYPLAARRRVLRQWLHRAGVASGPIAYRQLDEIETRLLGRRGSGSVQISKAHDVVRRYASLLVVERSGDAEGGAPFRGRIALSGETLLDPPGLRIVAGEGNRVIRTRPAGVGVLPARASICRCTVGLRAVHARSWKAGDRIKPLGLRGTVKLQDLFVNHKVPRAERDDIPIFECKGEIIWIPGYRVASGWEVTARSEGVLEISVERT